jgi:flagellar basal-body rod protein FlgB
MPFPITDPVGGVLHAALDGLALRQRVIADNIANIDTPGYRASSVVFEDALRAATGSGSLDGVAAASVRASDTPVGANGNNVDLRKETMAAMQTMYQYQVMTRASSDRASLVTAVAGGVR